MSKHHLQFWESIKDTARAHSKDVGCKLRFEAMSGGGQLCRDSVIAVFRKGGAKDDLPKVFSCRTLHDVDEGACRRGHLAPEEFAREHRSSGGRSKASFRCYLDLLLPTLALPHCKHSDSRSESAVDDVQVRTDCLSTSHDATFPRTIPTK